VKNCFDSTGPKGFKRHVCHDVTKYCSQSHKVCEDRPHYRPEPVLAQWCTYDTQEWRTVRKNTASGRDEPPNWPEVSSTTPNDRLGRAERYVDTIEYPQDGRVKKHILAPKTEAEFLAWKKGQRVSITFDTVGSVQVLLAH
jgi:hypothetical protein